MSSSLSKILETGINVFKNNSQVNINYIRIIDDCCLKYLNDLLGIKLYLELNNTFLSY